MLDYKDNYVLKLLLSTKYILSISDIQKLLGVSQRSVYYSISKINDFLEDEGLPKLENKRQIGIVVDPIIKEVLPGKLLTSLSSVYVFTPEERVTLEVLLLLTKKDELNIHFFEDFFEVSRNTIINDLRDIRELLRVYNLTLEYDQHNGYLVSGFEIQKRSVILSLISNYEYLLKISPFDLFTEQTFNQIQEYMKKLEQELMIKYVKTTLNHLSTLISIIKDNEVPSITISEEDKKQLEETKEFHAIKSIIGDFLNETEYYYISLHLLGLRIQVPPEYYTQDDDFVNEVVEFLIDEFSKLTLIYFDDDQTLYKNLYTHMKQALFRLKYGIIYQNELKDDILSNYPQVSQITTQVCEKLEQKLGYPIGEDDITFIAMHFGGALKREKQDIQQTKVLLVCLNGIATSKLLRKEILYLFNNIDIIDAISLEEIELYQDEVDYIISTIPIKQKEIKNKVIQVNPILTDFDKTNLLTTINTKKENNLYNIADNIVNDLERFLLNNNKEEVKQIVLKHLLKRNNPIQKFIEKEQSYMLKDLITKEMIVFRDELKTWEEAIWESAKPLLESGSIEDRYVEKVIQNVHDLGPYIGIAPDIAISHARPEDGVHKIGLTILILKKPVYLANKDNKPVRIMVTLAAPDNEQHLQALQQLSGLLMEDLDALLESEKAETVLKLIDEYSK